MRALKSIHNAEKVTRIIYARQVIPHNKIVPNWMEVAFILYDSKFCPKFTDFQYFFSQKFFDMN